MTLYNASHRTINPVFYNEISTLFLLCLLLIFICTGSSFFAQMPDASDRTEGEGEGPYERRIIRGGKKIDGTGSPALGPVDSVIEKTRIALIQNVGYPGLPINKNHRPKADD